MLFGHSEPRCSGRAHFERGLILKLLQLRCAALHGNSGSLSILA